MVLLQQPGSATQTPRYSVLCDGVEWVVAEGEHNAWEAIVLFLLQRAKRDGVLGGLQPSPSPEPKRAWRPDPSPNSNPRRAGRARPQARAVHAVHGRHVARGEA